MKARSSVLWLIVCFFIAAAPAVSAQEDDADPVFRQEELDQILAPIALYPDSLLTQILMASTFPLDVVQADRWARQHRDMSSQDVTDALESRNWDPSVKSLVNFPQVLTMMSEKLEWTQKVGDAFTAQQGDVLDAVQRLRAKAQEAGNLKTTQEQVVRAEKETIIIEPARPEVVYVPVYNPAVIYGSWWYPNYPPYYYYPPGYVAGSYVSFTSGVAVGLAWGYAWGYPNWRGRDIVIDVHRNVTFNPFIDRERYSPRYRDGRAEWKWRAAPTRQVQERRAFRGYTESSALNPFQQRTQPPREGQQQVRPRGMQPQPPQQMPQRVQQQPQQTQQTQKRGGEQGFNPFSGLDRGGSSVREVSTRGAASRQNMPARGGGGRTFGSGRQQ